MHSQILSLFCSWLSLSVCCLGSCSEPLSRQWSYPPALASKSIAGWSLTAGSDGFFKSCETGSSGVTVFHTGCLRIPCQKDCSLVASSSSVIHWDSDTHRLLWVSCAVPLGGCLFLSKEQSAGSLTLCPELLVSRMGLSSFCSSGVPLFWLAICI